MAAEQVSPNNGQDTQGQETQSNQQPQPTGWYFRRANGQLVPVAPGHQGPGGVTPEDALCG